MITFNEFYNLSDYESITQELDILIGQYGTPCNVPEFTHLDCNNFSKDPAEVLTPLNQRITTKIIKKYVFDVKRYWLIAAIFIDDQPVMIIRNAGRWGGDYQDRFITHSENYQKLVSYLYELASQVINQLIQYNPSISISDPNSDASQIYQLYGRDLSSQQYDWE